jgi:hypothetical protein
VAASTGPVVERHGSPPRGALTSVAALVFVIMVRWIGYCSRIVRERAKHGVVVFDRHLLDALVDPLWYRHGDPSRVGRAARRIVPRPDVIGILDAPLEVVRACRHEVILAESTRQSLEYRCRAPGTRGRASRRCHSSRQGAGIDHDDPATTDAGCSSQPRNR